MYSLLELVAKGPLCESWKAINESTGLPCFLKRAVDSEDLSPEFIQKTLNDSFKYQRSLSGLVVNKASRLSFEDGNILLEYPYLEPGKWQPLGLTDVLNPRHTCLKRVCAAIDYLHLMGMVHLDFTAQNILICSRQGNYRVRLVDLEFLRPSNTPCDGKILGTKDHIAPEIARNEAAYPESDNYSFGVALKTILDGHNEAELCDQDEPTVDALRKFYSSLTNQDRATRPRYLLDTLNSMGVLSHEEYDSELRRLLRLFAVSRSRAAGSPSLHDAESLQRFLREDCHILGIHPDLATLLADNYAKGKAHVGKATQKLIGESGILKLGEYWILSPSDSLLEELYKMLDMEIPGHSRADAQAGEANSEIISDGENVFESLVGRGRLEQAFFAGQCYLKSLRLPERVDLSQSKYRFMLELANVAHKLNRLNQADELYRCSSEAISNGNANRADIYNGWATVSIKMGNDKKAADIIDKGLAVAQSEGNNKVRLQLLRLRAWQTISTKNFDTAQGELTEICDVAGRHGYTDVVVMAQYSMAISEWRKGSYSNARSLLEKAAATCVHTNLQEQLLPIQSALALICAEMGDFQGSIVYCEYAAEHCETLHMSSQLPSICLAAVLAHTRLAEYDEAEHWLKRYLESGDRHATAQFLLGYYQAQAFLLANRGQIQESLEVCQLALKLPVGQQGQKLLGKIYQILALNHLCLGKLAESQSKCTNAVEIFGKLGDETSIHEVSLIAEIGRICYEEKSDLSEVCGLVEKLIVKNSLSFAMFGSFLVVISGNQQHLRIVAPLIERVSTLIEHSRVPLFSAMSALLHADGWPELGNQAMHDVLKQEFPKLVRTEQRFLAMLTALRIAGLYGELGRKRHQSKYLEQALQLASSLTNTVMVERISSKLQKLGDSQQAAMGGETNLVAISRILQAERDFNKSALQLLEFAVFQTGAERGVLLLKQGGLSRLLPIASLNCDDSSITDVTDFSSSVPLAALAQKTPTFIDDALIDKRTRGLKSIMLHNVRSIVASPLVYNGEPLGVLYLDHHTIPALFSKNDIEYVGAIANFIAVSLVNARNYQDLVRSKKEMSEDLLRSGLAATFLTRDPVVRQLLDLIPSIAQSDTPVLLLGESGTGKEILCKIVHDLSKRAKRPLVKMNCAAIASGMIEGELFGVAKGAATGVLQREGKFEAANGGTLYMDEIGDMSLEVQAKVLRVIEYQEFEKVGSNKPQSVDVRFVYATNKDLGNAVREGKFKNDLFYRISAIVIKVPPLRERLFDIPLLIDHFSQLFARGNKVIQFTPDAVATLTAYSWPGNVRELKNLVERYSVLYPGQSITAKMLPLEVTSSISKAESEAALVQSMEAESIRSALARNNWNRSKTATFLGMPLSTLRRKIEKLGIRPPL